MSGHGHWIIVRTQGEWIEQVRAALAAIAEANGGTDPASIRDAYDVDPQAFARMIEGMLALGSDVSPELIALAGLRDVGEVLG